MPQWHSDVTRTDEVSVKTLHSRSAETQQCIHHLILKHSELHLPRISDSRISILSYPLNNARVSFGDKTPTPEKQFPVIWNIKINPTCRFSDPIFPPRSALLGCCEPGGDSKPKQLAVKQSYQKWCWRSVRSGYYICLAAGWEGSRLASVNQINHQMPQHHLEYTKIWQKCLDLQTEAIQRETSMAWRLKYPSIHCLTSFLCFNSATRVCWSLL